MSVSVTGLAITPVKGTRLQTVEEIELGRIGARGNRRFFVIDERDRMVNAKPLGGLQTVIARCDEGRLSLAFPGGEVVEDLIAHSKPVTAMFFSCPVEGLVLEGPWSAALSEHLG